MRQNLEKLMCWFAKLIASTQYIAQCHRVCGAKATLPQKDVPVNWSPGRGK